MLDDLIARLRVFGLTARAAIARTLGPAWALARYGKLDRVIVSEFEGRRSLGDVPVQGLHLGEAECALLERLGSEAYGSFYVLRLFREKFTRLEVRLDETLAFDAATLYAMRVERRTVRCWRRQLPWPRVVLRSGVEVACLPTNRAAYGRLCQLLTAGNLRAPKAECHLWLDNVMRFGEADFHRFATGRRARRRIRREHGITGHPAF